MLFTSLDWRKSRLARFIYFTGDERNVSFISTVSPQRNSGLTAWQLLSDDKEGVLLKITPAFSDNPDERLDALDAVPLLPGYRAELRYLVQKDIDSKEWLEEWEGNVRQSLPLAVELVLRPLQRDSNDDVLEILAPIRSWRNPDIEPVVVN